MEDLASILKALSDPTRLRLLAACLLCNDRCPPGSGGGSDGRGCCEMPEELCVCQLVEVAGLATSTVSKHLSILKQAGLIASRKEGRWIYCRLPDESACPPPVRDALAMVRAHAQRDPEVAALADRLCAICAVDPEELCQKQRRAVTASLESKP